MKEKVNYLALALPITLIVQLAADHVMRSMLDRGTYLMMGVLVVTTGIVGGLITKLLLARKWR